METPIKFGAIVICTDLLILNQNLLLKESTLHVILYHKSNLVYTVVFP